MRIVGEWFLCTDGETRPVVKAHVADASGGEVEERFLVDTGADRTVFTTGLLASLGLPFSAPPAGIALLGLGSQPGFVVVRTVLTLFADDGSPARFRGDFAAFIDPAAADMSILLGRNILDHFDLIVSRRRNEILLLAMNHQYRIEQVP
jgi:hypothetical protein